SPAISRRLSTRLKKRHLSLLHPRLVTMLPTSLKLLLSRLATDVLTLQWVPMNRQLLPTTRSTMQQQPEAGSMSRTSTLLLTIFSPLRRSLIPSCPTRISACFCPWKLLQRFLSTCCGLRESSCTNSPLVFVLT